VREDGNAVSDSSTLLPAIQQALNGLCHGYVQIVVHDGRVVRIERVEKIHLPPLTHSMQRPTGHPGGQNAPSS